MEELKKFKTTLTLFIKDGKILLGEKKRGFAKGTLNGIGGKQDPGETIDEAMLRECVEEVGALPVEYSKVGRIHFNVWYKGEHSDLEMFVYKCTKHDGEMKETDEIIPHWFDLENVPFDRMLKDDLLWLPEVLKGKKIVGSVRFDENMNMLEHNFKSVQQIPEDEICK